MTKTWKVRFSAPVELADRFAEALTDAFDPESNAVATAEIEEHVSWSVEAYYEFEPDRTALDRVIAAPISETGYTPTDLTIEELPDINWVAKSLEGLEPIATSRFFVHGSHDADKKPAGKIPLLVDENSQRE